MALNMPGIKRVRFFMTFGQSYLTHLKVSGERRHDFDRADYVRRKRDRTAAVLKGSASGSGIPWSAYCWKTNIGCIFQGKKDGKEKKYYLYNNSRDHKEVS